MPASQISLDKAKKDKLFYFVANVLIYRESDGRVLLLKRSKNEIVHPGKFCTPGGKLEWADMDIKNPGRLNGDVIDFPDTAEKLLVREAREESGVEIEPKLAYINSVAFVRPDGIPVVLVKFSAKYKSGEVKLENGAFSDFVWVNAEEVKKYDCIDGIGHEVAQTIKMFRK